MQGIAEGYGMVASCAGGKWSGCYVHGGCAEGYGMVARCVEREMEWLLGAQRMCGTCKKGELISFDWMISIANQNLFWLMKLYK